jgi:hypothetical protein
MLLFSPCRPSNPISKWSRHERSMCSLTTQAPSEWESVRSHVNRRRAPSTTSGRYAMKSPAPASMSWCHYRVPREILQKSLVNPFHATTQQIHFPTFDPCLCCLVAAPPCMKGSFFGGVNLGPGMGPTSSCRFSSLERGEVAAGGHIARYPVVTRR